MGSPPLDTTIEQRAQQGDPAALAELISALRVASPLIRREAADALGRLASLSAVSALLDALRDPASGVRWSAALALDAIADPRAERSLLGALSDPTPEVREAAARALGGLGGIASLEGLRQALTDPQPDVRRTAVWALKAITDRLPPSADLPLPPSSLIEPVTRQPVTTHRRAARLFASLGGGTALISLVLVSLWFWNRPLGPQLTSPGYVPPPRPTSISRGEPICSGPSVMFVLLLGLDKNTDQLTEGFSDVIRLARVDFAEPSITVIALPRDIWLRIPGLESRGIVEERLRSAYAYGEAYDLPGGGVGLLADTLAYNFDVSLDHYVVSDFSAFIEAVDAIGGVDVEVLQPVAEFAAGRQHMDGTTALSYARLREDAPDPSDLVRIDRQTQVLLAIQEKLTRPRCRTPSSLTCVHARCQPWSAWDSGWMGRKSSFWRWILRCLPAISTSMVTNGSPPITSALMRIWMSSIVAALRIRKKPGTTPLHGPRNIPRMNWSSG